MKLIDCHSHVSRSKGGPDCNFDRYHDAAVRLGVVASLLAPGACPEELSDGESFLPCVWRIEDGKPVYVQKHIHADGTEQVEPASKNPYHATNEALCRNIRAANSKQDQVRYYATPLYHARLDSLDELSSFLGQKETAAIKLHGIASYVAPHDISPEAVALLTSSNVPLMVHTDWYAGQPERPMQHAYRFNDPLKWVSWAIENDVRLVALHGACLCAESFSLARGNDKIRFGISPDLLMMSEPERLKVATTDYLETLFKMASPEQLLFDIDYSWNTEQRGDWENLDWDMVQRVSSRAKRAGYSDTDIERVFHKNAEEFFNI
jgi:hypothetical protein